MLSRSLYSLPSTLRNTMVKGSTRVFSESIHVKAEKELEIKKCIGNVCSLSKSTLPIP